MKENFEENIQLLVEKHPQFYKEIMNSKHSFIFERDSPEDDHFENEIILEKLFLISEAIKRNNKLIELQILKMKVRERGVLNISKSLRYNSSLKSLTFSDTNLGDVSAKYLSESLIENESLENLNLSNNKIEDEGAKSLAFLLSNNNTLKSLNLNNNDLRENGLRNMCKSLRTNTTLEMIGLSRNRFTKEIKFLSQILTTNFSIKELYLGDNNIRNEGMKFLSKALKINSHLKKLSLSGSILGNEGVKFLSKSLKTNKDLEEISLESCYINDEQIRYLSEALEVNSSLKKISISKNKIVNGSKIFFESLKHNFSLHWVGFTHIKVNLDDVQFLVEVLKENSSLKKMKIYLQDLEDQSFKSQIKFLCKCNEEWTPSLHSKIFSEYQSCIFTFLLCSNHIKRRDSIPKFPKFILFEIFKKVERKSFFENYLNNLK